jgi:hypothetical protein
MRSPLRTLASLCLALILALTSVHWALGRAEAQGAQDLVICADGSLTTISLGADGRPVARHHACPDCVLGGLALAPAALPAAALARGRARTCRAPARPRAAATRPRLPCARGPPRAAA